MGRRHPTQPADGLRVQRGQRVEMVFLWPDEMFTIADAVIRLIGAVLGDQHDEWATTPRRYLSEASMAQLTPPRNPATDQPQLGG